MSWPFRLNCDIDPDTGHVVQDSRKSCWPRASRVALTPPTVHERGTVRESGIPKSVLWGCFAKSCKVTTTSAEYESTIQIVSLNPCLSHHHHYHHQQQHYQHHPALQSFVCFAAPARTCDISHGSKSICAGFCLWLPCGPLWTSFICSLVMDLAMDLVQTRI